MTDRENIKIVISAALVVVVASMGIYAFIYREKISQMLPNWQSKSKKTERVLGEEEFRRDPNLGQDSETTALPPIPLTGLTEDGTPVPGSKTESSLPTGSTVPTGPTVDKSTETQTVQSQDKSTEKSTFPPPDKSSWQRPDKTSQERQTPSYPSLPRTTENSGEFPEKNPPEEDRKSPSLPTKDSSEKSKSLATAEIPKAVTSSAIDRTKAIPTHKQTLKVSSPSKAKNTQLPKPTRKSQAIRETSLAPKAQALRARQPPMRTQSSKTTQPSRKTPGTPPSSQGTLESRVKNLESKFQIHEHNTGRRLDAIERRLERLEKNLPSP